MEVTRMWIVVSIAAALAISASAQRSPEVALRAAMETETVKGDLKGAIDQYKKVAQSGNRAVAAQALLRMAECYQKLGGAESRKIYEQLVRDYADMKEAQTARARLGSAATQAAGITTRQVWTGPKVDPLGTVSADGHYLSFVDWDTGDLAIHDMKSGEDRRLTNKGPFGDSNDFAEESVISPDGKQVAYGWFVDKAVRYELRVVNSSGTNSIARVLYSNENVDWMSPFDWSWDGRWIAVGIQRKDQTAQIGLVDANSGALRVLKSVDWRGSTKLSFSPDGKYLAYDLPVGDEPDQRDIFVLALDGSREIPAVIHPALDTVIGWTPDGRNLLFASDRTGSTGVWRLPFKDGKPQGAPELMKADIGRMQTASLTHTGAMYFSTKVGGPDIYTAAIDFSAGKVLGSAAPAVEQFIHSNRDPDWSPDGKQLVFITESKSAGRRLSLSIGTEGGRMRQLQPKLNYLAWPRWSPDGKSLVAQGKDLKGRQGIYRIDAQTGGTEPLVLGSSSDGNLLFPQWTPDGTKLVYGRVTGGQFAIIEREAVTGREREVIGKFENLQFRSISISPDSRYLAGLLPDPTDKKNAVLTVVPLAGGDPREILRVPFPGRFTAWSPDGRSILYTQGRTPSGEDSSELWMIPVAGGEPRKLDVGITPIRGLHVQPGANRIVFWSRLNPNTEEIWALENFLPKDGN